MIRCAFCPKPAVHHIIRITAKGLETIHMCQEHYQQFGQIGAQWPMPANEDAAVSKEESPKSDLVCQNCGRSFLQFRESSKFGCADCYDYFEEWLEPLLERLHKATQHEGKVPRTGTARAKIRREIQQLRRDKENAVSREDFETAARLRDRIRQLQGADEE